MNTFLANEIILDKTQFDKEVNIRVEDHSDKNYYNNYWANITDALNTKTCEDMTREILQYICCVP